MKNLFLIIIFCVGLIFVNNLCASDIPQAKNVSFDREVEAAWQALASKNYALALEKSDVCIRQHEIKNKDKASNSKGKEDTLASSVDSLVICLYVKAESYRITGEANKAISFYKEIVDHYPKVVIYSDWPWKPSESARERINEINKELGRIELIKDH